MPAGAELLTAREQGESICIWARVDTSTKDHENRFFHVLGTGHQILQAPETMRYVGTAMLQGGALVMHVFEELV